MRLPFCKWMLLTTLGQDWLAASFVFPLHARFLMLEKSAAQGGGQNVGNHRHLVSETRNSENKEKFAFRGICKSPERFSLRF